MNRRIFGATLAGALSSLGVFRGASAQFSEQEIRNSAQVVSTGDVNLSQDAAGNQEVYAVNGVPVTGDGVYQTSTGQVIVNDGQVVATGDVNVSQRASGSQTVYAETELYSGMPAGTCEPGKVIANPDTGQLFYQGRDCCWWPACAEACKSCKRC